ncbi:MAG TPA: hypothetical protein VN837_09545 [Chloroflexota bacterium]|nr:hypothetical protein [Chloroflexota bacterium]
MWQHEVSEAAERRETLRLRLLSVGVLAAGWAAASALPAGAAGSPAERAALAAAVALAGWFSVYHLGQRRAWVVPRTPMEAARHARGLVTAAPLGALILLAVFGPGVLPMVLVGTLLLLALEQLD